MHGFGEFSSREGSRTAGSSTPRAEPAGPTADGTFYPVAAEPAREGVEKRGEAAGCQWQQEWPELSRAGGHDGQMTSGGDLIRVAAHVCKCQRDGYDHEQLKCDAEIATDEAGDGHAFSLDRNHAVFDFFQGHVAANDGGDAK